MGNSKYQDTKLKWHIECEILYKKLTVVSPYKALVVKNGRLIGCIMHVSCIIILDDYSLAHEVMTRTPPSCSS